MAKKIFRQDIDRFLTILEGPKGCNFRKRKKDGKTVWNCKGGTDKGHSVRILENMGFSINQILNILKVADSNGGHCDCEILFNAEDALLNTWK